MFEITPINIATIIVDLSSIILVLGIVRQTRFMRQSGRQSDRLFLSMLAITSVMALSDIGGYLTEDKPDPLLIKIQGISMTIFYMAFAILVIVWFDYCTFRFKNAEKIKKVGLRPSFIPGILALCLVVINSYTGFIFSIDEVGGYHRGILFIPVYIVFFTYLIIGFVYIGKYRTADKKVVIPLWLYIAPIVISFIVTFVIGEISMAALGTSMTIVFTHLGTMNEIAEISVKESV